MWIRHNEISAIHNRRFWQGLARCKNPLSRLSTVGAKKTRMDPIMGGMLNGKWVRNVSGKCPYCKAHIGHNYDICTKCQDGFSPNAKPMF